MASNGGEVAVETQPQQKEENLEKIEEQTEQKEEQTEKIEEVETEKKTDAKETPTEQKDGENKTEEKPKKKKSVVSRIFSFKCLQPAKDEDGEPVRLRAPSKRKSKEKKKSKEVEEEKGTKEEKETKETEQPEANGEVTKEEEKEVKGEPEKKEESPEKKEESQEEKKEENEKEEKEKDVSEEKVVLEIPETLQSVPATLLAQAEKVEEKIEEKVEEKLQETKIEAERVIEVKSSEVVTKAERVIEVKSSEVVTKTEETVVKAEQKVESTAAIVADVGSQVMEEKRKHFLADFHKENEIHAVDFLRKWQKYDKDNNGYIASTELRSFLTDLMQEKGESTEKDKVDDYYRVMMELYDQNKDGKLDINELSHLLPVERNYLLKFPAKKIPQDEFENIFNHYDKDGDGTVADAELLALLKDMFDQQRQDINPKDLQEYADVIMEIYDIKKDGKLDRSDIAILLAKSQRK